MPNLNDNYDTVAIVHRFYSEGKRKRGGFDKLLDSFSQQGKNILLIEHPLSALKEGRNLTDKTVISIKSGNDFLTIEEFKVNSPSQIIRWGKEILFNLSFVIKNVKNKPVLMVADPLNGIVGILLKWKFSRSYYHCIDFSENRLGNKSLNWIYMKILSLCIKRFDVAGAVSKRIRDKIVTNFQTQKEILDIPNSIEFKEITRPTKLENIFIYSGGAIIKKYNYFEVLEILYLIKKQFPDIVLYAVGGLDEDPDYIQQLKEKINELHLGANVKFTGFIDKDELHKLYLRAKIGFSFYSKESAYYTYFGDSLKIREYALYGIPSVTDGNSATDDEMLDEKAGFIIKNSKEAVETIIKLLSDDKLYKKIARNAVEWARKTDKNKITDILSKKLFY